MHYTSKIAEQLDGQATTAYLEFGHKIWLDILIPVEHCIFPSYLWQLKTTIPWRKLIKDIE